MRNCEQGFLARISSARETGSKAFAASEPHAWHSSSIRPPHRQTVPQHSVNASANRCNYCVIRRWAKPRHIGMSAARLISTFHFVERQYVEDVRIISTLSSPYSCCSLTLEWCGQRPNAATSLLPPGAWFSLDRLNIFAPGLLQWVRSERRY